MQEVAFASDNTVMSNRLRQIPIFDSIDDAILKQLFELARFFRFEPGEIIIREGETDKRVFFLLEGACMVEVESLAVASLKTVGDVFGEMGLADSGPRSATVRAMKSTLCMVFDGTFLEQLEQSDKIAAKAMFYRIFSEVLVGRIRQANFKIMDLEKDLEQLALQRTAF